MQNAWQRRRNPDDVPTPLAVAVSDFCRRTGVSASPAEVRDALSLLSEDEDFRVRTVTDAEPEARPLGPWAVIDILRGTTQSLAATRHQSGYYDLARELVLLRESPAPADASGVEAAQVRKRSEQQTRSDEQHDRQRDLRDDEDPPRPVACGSRDASCARDEETRARLTGRLDRRTDSEDQAAADCKGERDQRFTRPDADRLPHVERISGERFEATGGECGDAYACHPAGYTENSGLDQQLAHDRGPSAAERKGAKKARAKRKDADGS